MSATRWIKTLVALAVVFGVIVAVWQYWGARTTANAPGQSGWVSTQWGPLGPGDRDGIIKVRLAGLWEHPVGQEAEDRATQPRVREIAGNISREHLELDKLTIDAARDLGVLLPNQPSEQQRAWMTEISGQSGATYDSVMVNRLRQAHGQVLPLLAQLRTTTRNERARALYDQGITYVSRHIGYLESTGLVNFDELPEPPSPPRAVVTTDGRYENLPVTLAALATLAVAALLAWWILARLFKRGRKPPMRHAAQRSTDETTPTAVRGPPAIRSADLGIDGNGSHRAGARTISR